MNHHPQGGGFWREALGWLVFPIVPVVLTQTYVATWFLWGGDRDPRDWGTWDWIILTGPLWGYGFLAGATLRLPDDPNRRGVWSLCSRRALWVSLGPWVGFLVWMGIYFGLTGLIWMFPPLQKIEWPEIPSEFWKGVVSWVFVVGLLGTSSYGWLVVAVAALRRAKRLEQLRAAIGRGLAVAVGFVGSLFGSFWAVTATWRSYFFDPTIVPSVILAVVCLTLGSGCASTVTVGELRRRELFSAMLMAWVLGLALLWRWWSRSRPGPSGR